MLEMLENRIVTLANSMAEREALRLREVLTTRLQDAHDQGASMDHLLRMLDVWESARQ